ncbi:hypothetical protein IFR04_014072, partial [Cadophora malorum]
FKLKLKLNFKDVDGKGKEKMIEKEQDEQRCGSAAVKKADPPVYSGEPVNASEDPPPYTETEDRYGNPEQRKLQISTNKLDTTVIGMTRLAVSKTLKSLVLSIDELLTFSLLKTELPDSDVVLYYQWTPTATFHPFSNLPVEIQLYIWKLSRPRRKIFVHRNGHMLRCRIAVPSLLQVNRASRIEMLKHYTAPAHIPGVPDRRPALSQYYFDPTIEIVVFRSYIHLLSLEEHMNAAEDIFVAESLATLQSSIIGSTWWSVPWKFFDPISTSTPDTPPYYRHSRNNLVRFFRTLSSLRDLVLVGGSCALKYDY